MDVPPLFFAALRSAVIALAVVPWLLPMPRPRWRILVVGILMGGGGFALFFVGPADGEPVGGGDRRPARRADDDAPLDPDARRADPLAARPRHRAAVFGVMVVMWDPRGLATSRPGCSSSPLGAFCGALGAVMMKQMEGVRAAPLPGLGRLLVGHRCWRRCRPRFEEDQLGAAMRRRLAACRDRPLLGAGRLGLRPHRLLRADPALRGEPRRAADADVAALHHRPRHLAHRRPFRPAHGVRHGARAPRRPHHRGQPELLAAEVPILFPEPRLMLHARACSTRRRSRRADRRRGAEEQRRPRAALRPARLPPLLGRRASRHADARLRQPRGADRPDRRDDGAHPGRQRRRDAAALFAAQGRRDVFDVRRPLSRPHRPRPWPRAGQRPEDRLCAAARPPPRGARRFSRQLVELLAYLEDRLPPIIRSAISRTCRACRMRRSPISSARRCRAASGPASSACPTSSPTSSIRTARRSPTAIGANSCRRSGWREPRTIVAVWALAAETDAEAERLSASHRMAMRLFLSGTLIPVPPVETALKFLAEQPPAPPELGRATPHLRLARESAARDRGGRGGIRSGRGDDRDDHARACSPPPLLRADRRGVRALAPDSAATDGGQALSR